MLVLIRRVLTMIKSKQIDKMDLKVEISGAIKVEKEWFKEKKS